MKLSELEPQQAPFTVEIEPTEGCNLGCSFCGLRGIREKGTGPHFFMTTETAKRIASQIAEAGWNSKIVFAGHGEPTLNPDFFEIVSIFRQILPNNLMHVITNGKGIVDLGEDDILPAVKLLEELKISTLILDNYSPKGDWSKIVDKIESEYDVEMYKGNGSFFNQKKNFHVKVYPLQLDKNAKIRNLDNHCGAAAPLDFTFNKKKCAKPFRELFMRYSGDVALCCDDFRGEYPIASIHETDIVSLWNHERFQAARVMLYNGDRRFHPCNGCNQTSIRVGLLPDYAGKKTLPEITTEVRKIAVSVSKENKPLTTIVKRKWEK